MRDPEKVFRLFQMYVEHLGPNRSREPSVFQAAEHGYWLTRELDAHWKKLQAHVQDHPGISFKAKRGILEHLEALRRHLRDVEDVADLVQTKLRRYDRDPEASERAEAAQQLTDLDAREDAFDGPAGGA